MVSDDTPEDGGEAGEGGRGRRDGARDELRGAAERLEESAGDVAESFDQRAVDLLSWLLDTETRARIYVFLRKNPRSTSQEVAEGTGLYPSTVREALAELHDDGTVTRGKRESTGAGNNPYEYEAIAPSALVEGVVEQVQTELNTVFNLDQHLGGGPTDESEPVTISVDTDDEADDGDVAVAPAEDVETDDDDGPDANARGPTDEGDAGDVGEPNDEGDDAGRR
jgi:predicted transcriptional regulator